MNLKKFGLTIALVVISGFLTINYFALPALADTAECGSGNCECSCKGGFCQCEASGGDCLCFCATGEPMDFCFNF